MNIERVIAAIRTINRLHDLGDAVYDVREQECQGWTGPKVTEYSAAHQVLLEEGVFLPEADPKLDAASQQNSNGKEKSAESSAPGRS